jgi:hypothetical protein
MNAEHEKAAEKRGDDHPAALAEKCLFVIFGAHAQGNV